MDWIKRNFWYLIVSIIYLVGIVGFIYKPMQKLVIPLTPVNLILSALFIYLFSNQKKANWFWAIIFIFILGFMVELIGVKTTLLFGTYWYTKVLGISMYDIPVVIGINWIIVIFGSNAVCHQQKNAIIKSVLSALLCTCLDILIEPVAIHFCFWQWKNNVVPIQNYLAWFGFSFLFSLLFNTIIKNYTSSMTRFIFFLQFVFFAALYFFVTFG